MVKMTQAGQPQAAPAVGWPAAARRPGPGPREPALGAAARRAARRPRPQAARGDADRAEAAPGQVGITFVFVTHDQEEALSMSDRIAVMLDGHIEQLADPDTIYDHPASAFVAGFIGQNNFFRGVANRRRHRPRQATAARSLAARRAGDVVAEPAGGIAAVRPEAIEVVADGSGHHASNALPGVRGRRLPSRRRHPVRRARPATASVIARHPATARRSCSPARTCGAPGTADRVHLFPADAGLASCSPTRPRSRRRPEARPPRAPDPPHSRRGSHEAGACMSDDEVRILADPSSAASDRRGADHAAASSASPASAPPASRSWPRAAAQQLRRRCHDHGRGHHDRRRGHDDGGAPRRRRTTRPAPAAAAAPSARSTRRPSRSTSTRGPSTTTRT